MLFSASPGRAGAVAAAVCAWGCLHRIAPCCAWDVCAPVPLGVHGAVLAWCPRGERLPPFPHPHSQNPHSRLIRGLYSWESCRNRVPEGFIQLEIHLFLSVPWEVWLQGRASKPEMNCSGRLGLFCQLN